MTRAWPFLVLALGLSGCGGDDDSAAADAPPADAPGSDGPAADAPSAPDGAADAPPAALPLGTATPGGTVSCPPGAAPGAACQAMSVSCPGVEDIQAVVGVAQPPGTATGTVFMIYGGGGTAFFDQGIPAGYLGEGLRVVQVQFASAWEESGAGSIKAAACRPATLIRWAFDVPHGGSRTEAFCAHGHSGGAGAVSYALAHYGEDAILDEVFVDAGPVFGRIDYGCEPSLAGTGGTTRAVCPELPMGTFAYGGAQSLIDGWEDTSTCGAPYGDSSPADQARWAADSVVSEGADYDFPDTRVGFWFCANDSNEAAGLGSFFVDRVTSEKTVTCVTGSCMIEPPWSDPAAKQLMIDTMGADCVPRH